MNKTSKIVIGIVALILVVWGLSSLATPKSPTTKPVIKIGVTLPLTGGVASLGQANKNAIELAASQISKNTKYTYQLEFQDDQFNPGIGASNVNKMIITNKCLQLRLLGTI